MASPAPRMLPDEQARRDALDPTRSYIVQAPAGSGKTGLLVQRFLALLATVTQPEQIRALTFTRKAAQEMRNRVLEALAGAEAGIAPASPHEHRTHELARAAMACDRRHGWRILETPARLRVGTIDSLCSELAGRMPWTSRLGPRPTPLEPADELYRATAQATLARLEGGDATAAALHVLLRRAWGDSERLQAQLAALLATREQWLPHIVGRGFAEVREENVTALAALRRAALARAQRALAACGDAAELIAIARCAGRNLRNSGQDSRIAACADARDLPGIEPGDFAVWNGLAELLLTKEGMARARITVNEGFPTAAQDLKKRYQALQTGEPLLAALRDLRGLPPDPDEEDWRQLEATITVLRSLAAELQLQFQAHGAVDFTEITLRARAALDESGAPSQLAFALDGELRHLLIDEFQDTSRLQYGLIERLLDDWMPGDGRTLFLVGDPMQSIYGFRNADVGLFDRTRHAGIAGVKLQALALSSNFRSRRELIAWINDVFSASFAAAGLSYVRMEAPPEDAPAAAGAAPPTAGRTRIPGPVARVFENGTAAQVAAWVAERVSEAPERADDSAHTAILARKRSDFDTVLPMLAARTRAVEADNLLRLSESPVIQDLQALTRALLQPADRVAWLALLRARWCGLTLHDLHALCADAPDAVIWDLLGDPERLARLTDSGRERATRVREALAGAVAARGRTGLRALVEWCWRRLGGEECVAEPEPLRHAEDFFRLLEAGGGNDLDALARRLETLRQARTPLPAQGGAPAGVLAASTMHQVKGLEFDRVILTGLERRGRNPEAQLLYWNEIGDGRALLAPAPAPGTEASVAHYLRACARRRERQEELRLLYVAATRARTELRLAMAMEPKKDGGFAPPGNAPLHTIWAALRDRVEIVAAEAEAAGAGAGYPLLHRVADGWRPQSGLPPAMAAAAPAVQPASAGGAAAPHAAGPLARQVGVAVHAMLCGMAERGSLPWSEAALGRALRAAGVAPAKLESARRRAARALAAVARSERAQWILRPRPGARSEYALTGVIAGELRQAVIDRTFVDDDGTRWIIDYKTADDAGGDREAFLDREREAYRPQLELYAALTGGGRRRCGLYFPLLDGWREWEAGEKPEGE